MIRGFPIRMALRDLARAGRRLTLFILSISVGVAAIVAVGGFRSNLLAGLRDQGRLLLGADLELESRSPLPPELGVVLDSVAAAGGAWTEVTSTLTMVSSEASGRSALLTLQALEPVFPLYGTVETAPADLWERLEPRPRATAAAAVLVDPGVLTSLAAGIGDTLSIGETRAEVRAEVTSMPGHPGLRAAVGPRVYLPAGDLADTRLLQTGSIVTYQAFVRFADRRDASRFIRRYRPLLFRHAIDSETAAGRELRVSAAFDAVSRFLGLVGLSALLLGAVGVASAMHVYVRQRQRSAALLRCLGATGSTLVRIHLVQALALAGLGSVIGVGVGLALQAALPGVLREVLPVEFEYRLDFLAVGTGVLAGVWTATLFAWHAIAPLRDVPALGAIRRAAIGARTPARGPTMWVIRALIAATVLGLCVWQAATPAQGLAFAGAIGVALLALTGMAGLLMRGAGRGALRASSFAVRQGVANLFRPQNQTRAAVTAVGFGVFLVGTVAVVDRNVRDWFSGTFGEVDANVAVFDVPPEGTPVLREILAEGGHPELEVLPVIPARLHAVGDRLVGDLLEEAGRRRGRRGDRGADGSPADGSPADGPAADSASRDERPSTWALRRTYRNSIRDTLVEGETVVEGRWWGREARAGATPTDTRVSLDADVARALGMGVGDVIAWDVQGRIIESEIANLREIDWSRIAPNFIAVFEPGGAADGIPRTDLVLTRIDDAEARRQFQARVVDRVPGALVFDLASLQALVERVLDRAAIATRFMGAFTLAAGLLILAATVIAARGLRLRENALLRALGADGKTLRGILTAEFLVLGSLSGLAGVVLASLASWALIRFVFRLPFSLPLEVVAGLWAAAALLTLGLGALGSQAVTRPPALAAIRESEAIG